MLYRNKKTGAVLEVRSVLGGNWEPVETENKEAAPEAASGTAPKKKTAKKKVSEDG